MAEPWRPFSSQRQLSGGPIANTATAVSLSATVEYYLLLNCLLSTAPDSFIIIRTLNVSLNFILLKVRYYYYGRKHLREEAFVHQYEVISWEKFYRMLNHNYIKVGVDMPKFCIFVCIALKLKN